MQLGAFGFTHTVLELKSSQMGVDGNKIMNWHLNDISKLPEKEKKIVVNALPWNVDFASGVDDGLVLQGACYTAAVQ